MKILFVTVRIIQPSFLSATNFSIWIKQLSNDKILALFVHVNKKSVLAAGSRHAKRKAILVVLGNYLCRVPEQDR